MVVRIRPPTCGLPVAILEFVVYRDPMGCLTAFCFSPFEVRDDSNPSGDRLSHLNRIKLGGAATPSLFGSLGPSLLAFTLHRRWSIGVNLSLNLHHAPSTAMSHPSPAHHKPRA